MWTRPCFNELIWWNSSPPSSVWMDATPFRVSVQIPWEKRITTLQYASIGKRTAVRKLYFTGAQETQSTLLHYQIICPASSSIIASLCNKKAFLILRRWSNEFFHWNYQQRLDRGPHQTQPTWIPLFTLRLLVGGWIMKISWRFYLRLIKHRHSFGTIIFTPTKST